MNQLSIFDFIPSAIDTLVDWVMNMDSSFYHYSDMGMLKTDDLKEFLKGMKDIYYNCLRGHWDDYIYVRFNHWEDKKVHFKIEGYPFMIISFDQFVKAVWKNVHAK